MHFEQSAILTVHNHVITRNPRISVTHDKHDKHKTWFLHISNVQEEDKGRYMCQINTVTAKTQFGYLHVVGKFKWTFKCNSILSATFNLTRWLKRWVYVEIKCNVNFIEHCCKHSAAEYRWCSHFDWCCCSWGSQCYVEMSCEWKSTSPHPMVSEHMKYSK